MRQIIVGALTGIFVVVCLWLAYPAKADGVFLVCPSGQSGVATSVTSCAFADNVRYNYMRQGGGTYIDAYSPVTGQYYVMQCSSNYVAHLNNGTTVLAAECVGGSNAAVVIW